MPQHRGQGAFEYVLMLSGTLLIVVMIVFLMQGSVSSANNTLASQAKTVQAALDPSFFVPGAKPVFMPQNPADGAKSDSPRITALIMTTDCRLSDAGLNWAGTQYPLYDNSLRLSFNLDDASATGDSASTAADASNYGNNGTIYGNTLLLLHADESGGSTVLDESRFAVNGTCYSGGVQAECLRTTGVSGNALDFNGPGTNRATYVSGPNLNINGSFTLETWIKLKSTQPGTIFAITGGSTDGPGGGKYHLVFWGGSQAVTFSVQQPRAWTQEGVNSPALPLNAWHHIVGVWDRPANRITIYYDGTYYAQAATTVQYLASSNSITIGALNTGYYWLNGSLDEIGLYNRTLGADEIRQHYQAGRAKHADATIGAWQGGMNFDGADDYTSIPASESLNFTGPEFTVLLWAKGTYAAGKGLIQKGLNGFDSNHKKGFGFVYAGNPQRLYGLVGNGTHHFELDTGLGTFGWTQLGIRRNADGKFYLIKNGTVAQGGLYDRPAGGQYLLGDINTVLPLELGRSAAYGGYWNGAIDEVRVYDRALSDDEISKQFKSNLAKMSGRAWVLEYQNSSLGASTQYSVYSRGLLKPLMSTENRTISPCIAGIC